MKWLTFLMAGVALLLSATTVAEAAWGLNVVGDIWQQADSSNAAGTVYADQNGVAFLKVSAGRDPAGGNVSLDIQNLLPSGPDGSGRGGLDCHPTVKPTIQAVCEIVLYTVPKNDPNGMHRYNISAMADGTLRIGQESAGIYGHKAVIFANETREGQVQAGTEDIFGYDATQRAGNSTPINIKYGHIRFDVPGMGGFLDDYWIGRGGAGVEFNAPYGGCGQLLNHGTAVVNACGDAGGGKLAFFNGSPVYKPIVTGSRAGADDVTLSMLGALAALGLIQDATTP